MPNLDLEPERKLSTFRRLALGTWRTAYDPSVYGSITLRVGEAQRYIDAFRAATGKHLTITHLVARAVGATLEQVPEANVLLRFGRIYRRREIAVFFQVAMEDAKTGKVDLSGATIHEPHRKSLVAICDELEAKFADVRSDRDTSLAGVRRMLAKLPQPLVSRMLRLSAFASYTLNLDMRWAGVPRDAFGSVMVTNVGSLGLDEAWVPLVPYSRVPLLLALGAIRDSSMKVCATFDHRVLDGAHAAAMTKILRAWIEEPFAHFEPIPQRRAA
jgi:pyruvate dehydrogenase E2 component (dihydrolipoamide acetyltransferase)